MKMAEGSPNRHKNTVGRGEIARYGQFLLFPQCFQKTCTADTYKPGLVRESVNKKGENKFLKIKQARSEIILQIKVLYVAF